MELFLWSSIDQTSVRLLRCWDKSEGKLWKEALLEEFVRFKSYVCYRKSFTDVTKNSYFLMNNITVFIHKAKGGSEPATLP